MRLGDVVHSVAHLYGAVHDDDAQWFEAHQQLHGAIDLSGRWVVRWELDVDEVAPDLWARLERTHAPHARFAATSRQPKVSFNNAF